MTSFRIGIRPNRRAAGRFIADVRRAIQRAFVEEQKRTGLSQSDIARKLEVDRSVVSREMHGLRDISLGRAAEYAWALGRGILFELPLLQAEHGDNRHANAGSVQNRPKAVSTSTAPLTNAHIEITSLPKVTIVSHVHS